MEKFTKIIESKTKDQKELSTDIEDMNDDLIKDDKKKKLIGSWEIVSIVDISMEEPISESLQPLIINAEVGNREIKRGEYIYITAQIKKPGQSTAYHHSQMGVIKVRVVDIYNTMLVLNNL